MSPENVLMLRDFVIAYKNWEKSVQLDLSFQEKEELFNEYARIRDIYFSHFVQNKRLLPLN